MLSFLGSVSFSPTAGTVTTAALVEAGASVGVVVGAAISCSVCFFIAGVLPGLLAAVLIRRCKMDSHKGQSAQDTAPPPPVYEEVESRQGKGQEEVKVRSQDFQLEENVAYGHVQ